MSAENLLSLLGGFRCILPTKPEKKTKSLGPRATMHEPLVSKIKALDLITLRFCSSQTCLDSVLLPH